MEMYVIVLIGIIGVVFAAAVWLMPKRPKLPQGQHTDTEVHPPRPDDLRGEAPPGSRPDRAAHGKP